MKTKFYLNVRENGSARVTKNKVALHIDEVSIGMEIELPDTLFQKPIINRKITVTEDMVSPNTLNADVKENIENALKGVHGVKIELTMPKEDDNG